MENWRPKQTNFVRSSGLGRMNFDLEAGYEIFALSVSVTIHLYMGKVKFSTTSLSTLIHRWGAESTSPNGG